MARKNAATSGDSYLFDPRTKAVMAQPSQDGIKEKVSAVREVVPNKSNNEIVLVLQYYEYNVEQTIAAYIEDGAKAALEEWHYPGNKLPSKKKKKNKNKQKQTPESDKTEKPVDQSSTNHTSNEKPSKEPTPEAAVEAKQGEVIEKTTTVPPQDVHVRKKSDVPAPLPQRERRSHSPHEQRGKSRGQPSTHTQGKENRGKPHSSSSQGSRESTPSATTMTNKPQHSSSGSHSSTHQANRPNTITAPSHSKDLHHVSKADHSHNLTSTPAGGLGSSGARNKKHAGLEKSTKDLQRQTSSLVRLKDKLNEEVERSGKLIHSQFEELHRLLHQREQELKLELDRVKVEGLETLTQRQERAADLKVMIDRAQVMNDSEVTELRADIKLFVSDRKIDEDLGRTIRFLYNTDKLAEDIKVLGEVVPVKTQYSTRRPSVSSVSSSVVSHDDLLTPTSPSPFQYQPSTVPSMQASSDSATAPVLHSSTLTPQELAELQQKLQNSLKLQGLPVKSPPRRQPAQRAQTAPVSSQIRSRGSSMKEGASGSGNQSGSGQDDQKKSTSRNARRRQRAREKEREMKQNGQTGEGQDKNDEKTVQQREKRPQRENRRQQPRAAEGGHATGGRASVERKNVKDNTESNIKTQDGQRSPKGGNKNVKGNNRQPRESHQARQSSPVKKSDSAPGSTASIPKNSEGAKDSMEKPSLNGIENKASGPESESSPEKSPVKASNVAPVINGDVSSDAIDVPPPTVKINGTSSHEEKETSNNNGMVNGIKEKTIETVLQKDSNMNETKPESLTNNNECGDGLPQRKPRERPERKIIPAQVNGSDTPLMNGDIHGEENGVEK